MRKYQAVWLTGLVVMLVGTYGYREYALEGSAYQLVIDKIERPIVQHKENEAKTSNLIELGYSNDNSVWDTKSFCHFVTRNMYADATAHIENARVNLDLISSSTRNNYKYFISVKDNGHLTYWGMNYDGEIFRKNGRGTNFNLKDTKQSIHSKNYYQDKGVLLNKQTAVMRRNHIANANDFANWIESHTNVLTYYVPVSASTGDNPWGNKTRDTNRHIDIASIAYFNGTADTRVTQGPGESFAFSRDGTVYCDTPQGHGRGWYVDKKLTEKMKGNG